MAEYIELDNAVIVANYAVDEHPYDKIPGKPETFSEYNQGWHDACDYIRNRLENLPATDVASVRRSFWESYDTSAYIGCDVTGEPRFAARKFYVCHNRSGGKRRGKMRRAPRSMGVNYTSCEAWAVDSIPQHLCRGYTVLLCLRNWQCGEVGLLPPLRRENGRRE